VDGGRSTGITLREECQKCVAVISTYFQFEIYFTFLPYCVCYKLRLVQHVRAGYTAVGTCNLCVEFYADSDWHMVREVNLDEMLPGLSLDTGIDIKILEVMILAVFTKGWKLVSFFGK